jgi:dynein heavy chain
MQETYEYIYNSVSSSNQSSFRIWITTEVHPKFPISLLQISVHFTYEPPEGTHLHPKKKKKNTISQLNKYI